MSELCSHRSAMKSGSRVRGSVLRQNGCASYRCSEMEAVAIYVVVVWLMSLKHFGLESPFQLRVSPKWFGRVW